MSKPDEIVLCIPAGNVLRMCAQGLARRVSYREYVTEFITFGFKHIARSQCESDPTWRQVIPYIVVWRGDEILTYRRGAAGSEGRLHDLYSVGIGGHVNEQDAYAWWAIRQAARRELAEEIGPTAFMQSYDDGLLIDNTNDVGRVHIGILMHASLDGEINAEKHVIDEARFMPVTEAANLNLETWSRLVVKHLMEEGK